MDHTKKKKQINNIMNVLKKCKISNEGYDSTEEPFFNNDNQRGDFDINFEKVIDIPSGLNRNISLIYDILGNPKKEIYIGEWTIMNLEKAMEIYDEYCKNNRKDVFDIGYKYLGMGHIQILSCDLKSHLLFYHRGGGSSGWDREANFKEIIQYGPTKYDSLYFSDWFYKIIIN